MKSKTPENISEFITRQKSSGQLRRNMRRHSAQLREAFDAPESDAQWLFDQAGNGVDPAFAQDMINRIRDTSGENPRMEASPGSWILIAAFDEIMTKLYDPGSEWDSYALVCANTEGCLLLRLLTQQKVISEHAHMLARTSLSTYIKCWLSAILRETGDEKIIFEFSPNQAEHSPEYLEDLH